MKCVPCSKGTSGVDAKRVVSCDPCDAGLYQPATGATTCLDCVPGTYQEQVSTHEELRIVAEKVAKSRVAKLSSVVFDKWTATEESFLAWRDTMAAAQKLTWRSVCQLTMAQKTLIEERNDDGSYC